MALYVPFACLLMATELPLIQQNLMLILLDTTHTLLDVNNDDRWKPEIIRNN